MLYLGELRNVHIRIGERYLRNLKRLAVCLGVASAIAMAQGWYLGSLLVNLPFCMIWAYYGWLKSEPHLKWLNILFSALYSYGIARHFLTVS